MSYMRDPFYVWTDGNFMHIAGPGDPMGMMPLGVFDELIAMRWAQLSSEERSKVMERAVAKYSGNSGCDALCKIMGVPGFAEQLKAMVAVRRVEEIAAIWLEGSAGSRYWLPESIPLPLTALEAGWLQAVLLSAPKTPCAKPDAEGQPVKTTMPDRIGEKLWLAVKSIVYANETTEKK